MRTSAGRPLDRGAHAPPRAGLKAWPSRRVRCSGDLAEPPSPASFLRKVRDREGAITPAGAGRGACAPQKIPES